MKVNVKLNASKMKVADNKVLNIVDGVINIVFEDNTNVGIKFKTKKYGDLVETISVNGIKTDKIKVPWTLDQNCATFNTLSLYQMMATGRVMSQFISIVSVDSETYYLAVKPDASWTKEKKKNKRVQFSYSSEVAKENEEKVIRETLTPVFANMLELQDSLNIATAGEEWKLGTAANGKGINWFRCMYLEGAELVESYPYKHWKNVGKPADMLNVRVETTDVWHFLMSQMLALYNDVEVISNKFVELYISAQGVEGNDNQMVIGDTFTSLAASLAAENIIDLDKTSDEYYETLNKLIKTFFSLTKSVFSDIGELEGLYYGKNALNRLRQNNGYKEGSYVKMWASDKEDGTLVEDNVVMMYIVDMANQDGVSPNIDTYLDLLEAAYLLNPNTPNSSAPVDKIDDLIFSIGENVRHKEDSSICFIIDDIQEEDRLYGADLNNPDSTLRYQYHESELVSVPFSKTEILLLVKEKVPGKSYNTGHVVNRAKRLGIDSALHFTSEEKDIILNSF